MVTLQSAQGEVGLVIEIRRVGPTDQFVSGVLQSVKDSEDNFSCNLVLDNMDVINCEPGFVCPGRAMSQYCGWLMVIVCWLDIQA